MMSDREDFLRNLLNVPGWRTRRKIVVIESDDWGSIRMPSSGTLHRLEEQGLRLRSKYNQNDSLATSDDLDRLFGVLRSVTDGQGHPPIITANCLVANPDFEKIEADGFEKYHYELFTDTLKKAPGCEFSFDLWKEGIAGGIFRPQFHGREHVNVNLWLKALRSGHKETKAAFGEGFWSQTTTYHEARRHHFLASCDFITMEEIPGIRASLEEGLGLFEQLFGYRSLSFVPSNYILHPSIDQTLSDNGIRFIQGTRRRLIPREDSTRFRKEWRVIGRQNGQGLTDLVRNVSFEPYEEPGRNWVDACMREISQAFGFRKPATICAHRVNFMGTLRPENREQNLAMFGTLLHRITQRWPDVEFMSSDRLGELITKRE
jgi:hypothetical protein